MIPRRRGSGCSLADIRPDRTARMDGRNLVNRSVLSGCRRTSSVHPQQSTSNAYYSDDMVDISGSKAEGAGGDRL
jgi:hypothetical protein